MQAMIALVVGIVFGVVVLVAAGRGIEPHSGVTAKPTALGWCSLAFGVIALAVVGLGLADVPVVSDARVSIATAAATVVVVIGALVKGDRHWPTWVGLGVAVLPVFFWIVFVAGELAGPAH